MNQFDADYFLRGKQTGKSCYEDYRWLPDLTIPMARTIAEYCGFASTDRVLDFGCARGYTVKALRLLGFDAYGADTSEWAIENADESVREFVQLVQSCNPLQKFGWVVAKDVLEHIPYVSYTITRLMSCAEKGVFAVVPLSAHDNSKYVVEEYELDVTHIQRKTLNTWVEMFLRPGWRVEAAYRVPGIKDNYSHYPTGNGFITCRRI